MGEAMTQKDHHDPAHLLLRINDPGSPAFEAAREKGKCLWTRMNGAQTLSQWQEPQDLIDAGYAINSKSGAADQSIAMYGGTWTRMGLAATDFEHWKGTHEQTGAIFQEFFSAREGVFVAHNNCGSQTPNAISKWSDVTFLMWKQYCSSKQVPVDSLKVILRHPVTNMETRTIVNEVVQRLQLQRLQWPGAKVTIDSLEGHALLGTPNGKGVAWMLIQHEEFEKVSIDSVYIIFESTMFPTLAFKLGSKHFRPWELKV